MDDDPERDLVKRLKDSARMNWGSLEEEAADEIKRLRGQLAEYQRDREAVAAAILSASLTTGHGDTAADMVREVLCEVTELRQKLAGAKAKLERMCAALEELRGTQAWGPGIERALTEGRDLSRPAK